MGRPEAHVENYFRERCKKLGFLCIKFAPCGINGVPDRVFIGNGHTVFVELKAKGEKPRPNQLAIHRKMRKAGADVRVIDNRDDIDRFLDEMQRTNVTDQAAKEGGGR